MRHTPHSCALRLVACGRSSASTRCRLAAGASITGERLWTWTPPRKGDFNVPTPIVLPDGVLVATENNGARRFRVSATGVSEDGACAALAPDSSSPVVQNGHVYGLKDQLVCADLNAGLKTLWTHDDAAYGNYCSLITGQWTHAGALRWTAR